ncbi:VOC family protein [Enterococcus rivorum]|uniref:Glyoxalase n=1 Tax=Enterococcus rivorum TaxID=762845 RepID=A0A1E5KV25_9ENTE|nr:hypothetical protein [Enterococcus rivorum]MBP2100419.1 putative lactoylglutathione lyase [Enterococcus rivorum]OEH81721.1 hypothetical protein BCR26_15795 [Enterococcus rivorum]
MEFYPMPLFVKIETASLNDSVRWYQNKLGFISVFDFSNENNMIIMSHLRREKYQDLMLIQADQDKASDSIVINLNVENIKEIRSKMDKKEIINELKEQPWNVLELTVRSFEGTMISLTEQINPDKTFEEVFDQS